MGTSTPRKRSARTLHGHDSDEQAMPGADLPSREKRSRQQPGLSCHSCRARKLRCNREHPCSNCVARNVECQRQGDSATTAAPPPSHREETSSNAELKNREDDQASRSSVESRLERLEAVMGLQLSRNTQSLHNPYGTSSPARIPSESSHRTPTSTPGFELASAYQDLNVPPCPKAAQANSDVARLERAIVTQDQMFPAPRLDVRITLLPLHQLINLGPPVVFEPAASGGSPHGSESSLRLYLPTASEANTLIEKYIEEVNYLHPIVHKPSLRKMMDNFYKHLETSETCPSMGQAVLLMGVFTSTFYFSAVMSSVSPSAYLGQGSTDSFVITWTRSVQDLVYACQRRRCLSLEVVQAIVMVAFVIGSFEGASYGCRCMITAALMMGNELGMDRIDDPLKPWQGDYLQTEMARRTWWHLVASEWIVLARQADSQSLFCQTSPSSMKVNYPCNADDDDLLSGLESARRPMSKPSEMSYFLQRLGLAGISHGCLRRKMQLKAEGQCHRDVLYSHLLEVDFEFDHFYNQLPPFFYPSYDKEVPPETRCQNLSRRISIHRYLLNSMFFVQRCRLHLPFLVRAVRDKMYVYSRKTCLESARQLIQNERALETNDLPFVQSRLKQTGLLYGTFIAYIALTMDRALNSDASRSAEDTVRDVDAAYALHILEVASRKSSTVASLLQTVTAVLSKHGAKSKQAERVIEQFASSCWQNGASADTRDTSCFLQSGVASSMSSEATLREPGATAVYSQETRAADGFEGGDAGREDQVLDEEFLSNFDNFTESWSSLINSGSINWDSMIRDLNSAFP